MKLTTLIVFTFFQICHTYSILPSDSDKMPEMCPIIITPDISSPLVKNYVFPTLPMKKMEDTCHVSRLLFKSQYAIFDLQILSSTIENAMLRYICLRILCKLIKTVFGLLFTHIEHFFLFSHRHAVDAQVVAPVAFAQAAVQVLK
jgi:hypothetical protein